MSSFFDEIKKNKIKSILLLVLFGALFAAILYLLILVLGGGLFAFIIGVAIVAGYAAFSYHMGSRIVLKASGAKKASRKDYPVLFDTVEGLAAATQIGMPEIYVINDPNPNAFATGRNRKHASIAVTTGLLQTMNRQELEGVISHEISHVANNDIQFMMFAVVFAGVIGIVAALMRWSLFFGAGSVMGGEGRRGGGMLLLIALLIGFLTPFFAMLLRLAISRRREYMADANGARITRAPMHLASALRKIQQYENKPNAMPVQHVNSVTAMLYFENPLSKRSLANLLSTHPPIGERIKLLEQMY